VAIYRAVVKMHVGAGNSKDDCDMSFSFVKSGAVNVGDATVIANELATRMNTAPPAPANLALCQLISSKISRVHKPDIEVFDAVAGGSPVFTLPNIIWGDPLSAYVLPPELAACLSFRGDYGSAVERGALESIPTPEAAQDMGAPATHPGRAHPRARLRGRVYVGPLQRDQIDPSTGQITLQCAENIGGFGKALRDSAVLAAAGIAWAVHSRRNGSAVAVTNGYCDTAPDIQRRRGEGPLNSWIF